MHRRAYLTASGSTARPPRAECRRAVSEQRGPGMAALGGGGDDLPAPLDWEGVAGARPRSALLAEVGSDERARGAQFRERAGHGERWRVAALAVSHDRVDSGEAGIGGLVRGPEARLSAGHGALVGRDLGVGQAGRVVDHRGYGVEPDPNSLKLPGGADATAVSCPAAPVGTRPIGSGCRWTSHSGWSGSRRTALAGEAARISSVRGSRSRRAGTAWRRIAAPIRAGTPRSGPIHA